MMNAEDGSTRRDLPARTFAFAQRVVMLCRVLDKTPGVTVGRSPTTCCAPAGTSIEANVKEGQAGQSRADFVSKLSIAYKEARETHYWLRLLAATNLIHEARINELTDEANQLIAILTTIIKNARKKGNVE